MCSTERDLFYLIQMWVLLGLRCVVLARSMETQGSVNFQS